MSSAGKASKGRRSTGPSAQVRALQKDIKNLYGRLNEEIVAKRKAQGEYAELERKYARLEHQLEASVTQSDHRLRVIAQRDGWIDRQRDLDAQRIKEIKARVGGGDGE